LVGKPLLHLAPKAQAQPTVVANAFPDWLAITGVSWVALKRKQD
jgi:hypothetical protein